MSSIEPPIYRSLPPEEGAGRPLLRYARVWSLWGLGVSAVIAGEFSGWSYGLIEGGFGGLLIAAIVIALMYVCLCCSLAEMACAMPSCGAGYAYGRLALGRWGGFIAGLAQNCAFIFGNSAIVIAIGDYLAVILRHTTGVALPEPLLWAATYALFVLINCHGVALTFQIAITLSVISIAVLVGFCLSALPHFSLVYALEVPVKPGGSAWLPSRLSGIALAIPFAIWFLCFIEQVTLAVEETEEPARTLPKGIIYGIATLIALAFPVLFLNSGIPPGAQTVGSSNDPLLLGFQGIFGAGVVNVAVIVALLLSGQVATFHSVTYAYGRTIFSLARAGYLPRLLSRTHRTRKTPNYALVAGALIGYGAAVLARFGPATYKLDAVLLNMSVFAAVISYVIQMTSFLLLRRNYPELERPYRSPFGSTGAMTALVISLACLVLLFFNPTYRLGLMGCAVLFVLGALYFAIFRRNRLVLSPEEGFAVAAETARGAKRQAAAPSMAPAVAQFQSRDSRA